MFHPSSDHSGKSLHAQNHDQNQAQHHFQIIKRSFAGLLVLSGLGVLILSFQNCGGSGAGSGDTATAAAATGTVSLLPESGLSNPRLQILSDSWTSSGQNPSLAKNLGCIDALQNEFPNCSAWSLIQTKQLVSQTPGALLPSGLSLISDPAQLFAFADTDWGTALFAILSVVADSSTGATSNALRTQDSQGLTMPGTFRVYRDTARAKYGFEIAEQNGFINSTGGQIEALQADFLDVNGNAPNLSHPVSLSLEARVSGQRISFYTTPNETLNVRSLFYSQATLAFKNAPTAAQASRVKSLKLRFIHGDSANFTLPVTSCKASDSGYDISLQQNLPNENIRYDMRVGSNLNSYRIDLNAHLCSLLSQTLTCTGQIGGQSVSQVLTLGTLTGAADLNNWSLLTEQTGIETSKAQASTLNSNLGGDAKGEVATRVQLENIAATQNLDQSYSCPTGVTTRVFTQGVQTLREVCGYGAPIGINWLVVNGSCYQKVIGDQKCVAGKVVKTACAVPNPGSLWTPIDDECYSFTTTSTCT